MWLAAKIVGVVALIVIAAVAYFIAVARSA